MFTIPLVNISPIIYKPLDLRFTLSQTMLTVSNHRHNQSIAISQESINLILIGSNYIRVVVCIVIIKFNKPPSY
ncbi:Uncharacterised protein [uncultured Ruminococcus sp.]|nr:Uncharacterised protein [uncultured Ruminococcus sp.]